MFWDSQAIVPGVIAFLIPCLLNQQVLGLYQAPGQVFSLEAFHGLELEREGTFEPARGPVRRSRHLAIVHGRNCCDATSRLLSSMKPTEVACIVTFVPSV